MADDFRNGKDGVGPFPDFGSIGSGNGFSTVGTLEDIGDLDSFQFSLIAGVTYEIRLFGVDSSGGTLADPTLQIARLRDSFPVASDDDSGFGRDSAIIFTPQETIPYFANVSGKGGTGTWTFSLHGFDPFEGAAETSFLFMTNAILPSEQLPGLSQFAQTQFTFGQQIGVANPTVYMYEALGLALAESAVQGFLSPAGSEDSLFVNIVYETVFGVQPNAAQVQVFISQLDFFKSIYVASGAFGSDITHIQTLARGAVIGQMLGVNEDIANNNASTATANLLGTSATMDFELL